MRFKEFSLLFVYALAIAAISSYHEVWRDEVGVFSIIRAHPGFLTAFQELKQYGHPFLWYAVLWVFYQIIHAPTALQIAHTAVATLAAWIFVSRSPFRFSEKALFLLGYFPLYEYTVINRNYGISTLFLFVVAALYSVRFERMVLYCVSIFFLAQTHALSWIVALVLSAGLLFEISRTPKRFFVSFAILTAGLAISFYTFFPDKDTRATHFFDLKFLSLARESLKALIQCFYVSPKIGDLFGIRNLWAASSLLWVFYGLLFKRPILLTLFLGSFWAFNLFFDTVYFGALRHYGILYVLMWTVYWMFLTEEKKAGHARDWRVKLLSVLMLFLSLPQILMAYRAVEREIKMDYSASKSAAALINRYPILTDAILISEPPELVESLPYYVKNRVYFPRENKFGTTTAMRKNAMETEYSLDALLQAAKHLRQMHGKPVLILLAPGLAAGGPGKHRWAHGLSFVCSKESLARLSQTTKKIAGFYGTISGENYELYLDSGV